LTILSSSSGFCIGHTENIVSLDSSVDSTVTWDGITVLRGLILRLLYAIEDLQGIFFTLSRLGLIDSLLIGNSEESCLVLVKLLLLNDFISLLSADSEELINGLRRDRLLQDQQRCFLPSYKNPIIFGHQRFRQLFHAVCSSDGRTLL
jgi:hypothetical protein